jgi:hypothetical protein
MFQKTDSVGLEKHAAIVDAYVLGHAADPLQTLSFLLIMVMLPETWTRPDKSDKKYNVRFGYFLLASCTDCGYPAYTAFSRGSCWFMDKAGNYAKREMRGAGRPITPPLTIEPT